MSNLLKHLQKARQDQHLSQAEFGQFVGMPQSHLSKIESGKTDPRLSNVVEMARCLGLELMLVPRAMCAAVDSLIVAKDMSKQPRWHPDEEN